MRQQVQERAVPADYGLGRNQRVALYTMASTCGQWWPECGWVLNTPSRTRALMMTLSVRGLVRLADGGRWALTEAGRDAAPVAPPV